MGEPRPKTPPVGLMRMRRSTGRDPAESPIHSHLSAPASMHGGRNVRRRIDLDSPSQDGRVATTEFSTVFEFHVYLPNRTSVEVKVVAEKCKNLTVQEFVRLVREVYLSKLCSDMRVRQKQREIAWGDHVHIEDFHGKPVDDGEFALGHESKAARVLLLYDGHPDTVHAHSGFWNVTPEPQMLGVLPQDYTLFSALADEVDNSLQAVFQLEFGKQRLICVNLDQEEGKISIFDTGKGMDGTPQNCISKWGTIGSSMNRHSVAEAIGGKPPYLKPNFGMYGFGGIGAGLHLGGNISVYSKTEVSQRVAILHLGRKSLTTSVKAGSVWKTGGEFRSPTQQELQWSPHESFTKVEISDLSCDVRSWRVEEVQRKLKDYYFPYIQNDEGEGGITETPVEIRVNGENLAGIVGGEVAHANFHSSRGEPYVIILEFTKPKERKPSEHAGAGVDRANARITCHYFPIIQGREGIENIIQELKDEDSDFSGTFETFSRRSIRRLGRLLPDAGRFLPDDRSAGRLPFMEPKRFYREKEVNRHCYKRVKAFIDVDAGFIPTTSKMDLVQKHPFTKALLELGLGLQTKDTASKTLKTKGTGPVTISITRISKDTGDRAIDVQKLHSDYTEWLTKQHDNFDVGAVFNDGVIIPTQEHHKQDLNITKDVFRVVYSIECDGKINWTVGKEKAPKHLKLLKGLPGLKNDDKDLFVTVECFISDGLPDEKGDTKIICRPIEVPEDRGSKVEGEQDQGELLDFVLGESRPFPIEILFGDKYAEVDEANWQRRLDVIQSRLPAYIELLNEQDVSKLTGPQARSASCIQSLRKNASLKAGATLPQEIIAVVRPKAHSCTSPTPLEQKYVFTESMEMSLEVCQVKLPLSLQVSLDEIKAKSERKHETKVTPSAKGGLRGLYCFRLAGTELESFLRTTGTYVFIFTLVSVKYKEVQNHNFHIDITPSSKIGHWNICSHPGICSEHHPDRNPEVMKVRLGGLLSGTLYLTRVDEFSNPMEFTRIPTDVKCDIYSVEGNQVEISITIVKDLIKISDDHLSLEIPRIEVGGGKLELLKQTMKAALKMSVDGNPAADFPIAVLPGQPASARIKENNAPKGGLKPGQVFENIIFEILDRYQNPVSSGEKVRVLLDGFEWQDKFEIERSVDENGCLDLGMRLRVTAGYGETARVEFRSTEDLPLWDTAFDIIDRKLRVMNDIPERVAAGSQLKDIVIEAVDEVGQVDNTMDGVDHTLSLDWDPSIIVPLHQGRCTVPPIQIPHTPGKLWLGCVAHTKNSELKILLTVVIEEHEKGGDGSMASENPPNDPGNLESPAVPTRHFKSSIFRKKEVREVSPDNENNKIRKAELQAAVDRKKLEDKLKNQRSKVKKYGNKLNELKRIKKDHDDAMKQYQDELDILTKEVKLETPMVKEANEPTREESLGTFDCTLMQMAAKISLLGDPPGTHAAAILLQAQRERYSEIKDVKGIVGIVALLGAVEKEDYNRALVEFLGLEDMLSIVCDSRSAAECLGVPPETGSLNKNQGLLGFVKSRNLSISGRYRVITLTDESRFFPGSEGMPPGVPAIDDADPQKLLNISPTTKPGIERLVGSLGYAVNMIHLNDDQLKIRILGRGLRESLFFVLFGYLEVFDTTNNMLRAWKNIRTTAVSLDGGLIRKRNQYEMGSREDPVVWFPAVHKNVGSSSKKGNLKVITFTPRPMHHAMNNKTAKRILELKQKKRIEYQRYSEGDTQNEIDKYTNLLKCAQQKVADTELLIKSTPTAALTRTVAEVTTGLPYGRFKA
ncbi:hypothetical protein KC19_8G045600 [Ceratodon purpureus]|uniref:Structural maintenance of chromosomes flexible hinge domain-containing protein 1 n=2 Tax=Ceratodon purpureus TaxID=3225 RepID=A0A8T0GYH8_CERPU|nr:hypothetical protein KC19_8G045600 [Ceratodon purpureus]